MLARRSFSRLGVASDRLQIKRTTEYLFERLLYTWFLYGWLFILKFVLRDRLLEISLAEFHFCNIRKRKDNKTPPSNKDLQDNMPLIDHPDKWLKNHGVLHAKLESIDALKLITGSWLEPQLDDIKSLEPVAEEMRLQRFEKNHSKWVKTRGSSFLLLVTEFGGMNGCFGSLIDDAEGDPVKLYHAVKGNCVQDARGQFDI